jgi:hypothetical protein
MGRADPPLGGCPAPEDLTALAHGELDGAERETLSRHVLACAGCRAEYGASRRLLRGLLELGEGWRGLVPARSGAWRPVALGAGLAAAFLVAFLLPLPGGARVDSTASAEEVATLLETQRPDGSWPADSRMGGPDRDESATALALLALLPSDAEALRDGPVARAVAEGSRWLLDRQRSRAPAASSALADDAVSTLALLGLYDVTRDAGLRSALDRSVRRLARADASALRDPAVLPWVERALARARALGWDAPTPASSGAEIPWSRLATWTEGSSFGTSLRVLAQRPP